MAEQRLHSALAPIDILTRLEMEQVQRKGMEAFFHQEALGVSYKEINGNAQGQASVTIDGPDSGYAWSLKLVSAVLSSSTDVLGIYLGDSTNTAPIGSVPANTLGSTFPAITTFTSNVVIVQDQRSITLLSAAINAYKIIVKQVPGEMVVKL